MKEPSDLPTGWSEMTFGEVVSPVSVNDKKLPKGEYLETGRFPVVDQGQKFIGGYSNDEARVISDDLPLLVFGDHTRAFKYLDQPFIPGADGVKVLKPIGVDAKWLYQIAHALEFPDKGYARHYQHLKLAKLFVPPHPEQQRIVREIEKQFTRLDAGVAAFRRMQANLKRYRHSYLSSISKGPWPSLRIEEIGETVTGSTPSKNDPLNFGGALPFFKPTDLNTGYRVQEAREHLSSKGATVARVLPEKAILVTCIGATIGKTGLARVRCATNQQINALIPHDNIAVPEWLFWVLTSAYGQRQIRQNASATTLPILNKRRFQSLELPIPPLATQAELVTEIEKMASIIDKMEEVVIASLARAERLRCSILQKAFSGEL